MGEPSEKNNKKWGQKPGRLQTVGQRCITDGKQFGGGRVLVKDASGRAVWLLHAKIMLSQNSLRTPPAAATSEKWA